MSMNIRRKFLKDREFVWNMPAKLDGALPLSNPYLSGISCIVAGMSTSVRTFKKVTENDIKLPLATNSFIHVSSVHLASKVVRAGNVYRIKPLNLSSTYSCT